MKKVIEGKVYNTDTATEVASYSNGYGCGDFRSVDETLYKTKRGNWFLAGEGGPMTRYAQPCGNMTSGGEDIIPLTKEEALEWLEEHNETDAIEEHFGSEIEEA